MVRKLSCFCAPCVVEDWEACQNASHVLPWLLIKLKPNNTKLIRNHMEEFQDPVEWEFGGDGEELSDLLQTNDNFAILAAKGNAKGVQFYILQCQ
jgi:hypothetical protein